MAKLITLFLCITSALFLHAAEQPRIGNFALPSGLQPFQLFGFGQAIIKKGDCYLVETYEHGLGIFNSDKTLFTTLLYGIHDNFSLHVTVPVSFQTKRKNNKSSGLQDIILQGEFAFFSQQKETYDVQATIVGAFTLPTGSTSKTPPLGYGSPAFFLGSTVNYLSIYWYTFASLGIVLPTNDNCIKPGNVLLYEFGLGHNLAYKADAWILAGLFEFNGIFTQQNKIGNRHLSNTGSNVIYIGPNLFFSFKNVILQGGIQWPVVQRCTRTDFMHHRASVQVAFYF